MYSIDFKKPIHVHFIGIGGISMSGLATILIDRGFTVSGSDREASEITDHLSSLGALVNIGQCAENITDDIDLVVYTAAISPQNPEYAAAEAKGLPLMSRATLLGQLMANFRRSVAVSGTHGKTTTTSMLTHIFLSGLMDPTVSVGGMLDRIGGNIRVGRSDVFLTEACEYTNSFLEFYPRCAIILNVEEDHMDFFKDIEDIKHSFRQFASQTPEDGLVIINGDMEHTEDLLKGLSRKVLTFGLKPGNDYSAEDITFDDKGNVSYSLMIHGEKVDHVSLQVKGVHNVLNSLAAIACAIYMGMDRETILTGLQGFGGTHRRFEVKGHIGSITVVDDYAHHPTEIEATLASAKGCPHHEVWAIFQPHTYTRTMAFLPQFARALSHADHVVLADIYAAREPDRGLVSSGDIYDLLKDQGMDVHYYHSFEEIEDFVFDHVQEEDLVMTIGAGDIYHVGEHILAKKNK